MACFKTTGLDESLSYLVGPLKDIEDKDEHFYSTAADCLDSGCNTNQDDEKLFIPLSPLPPPLQQITYRKWKAGISIGQYWSRWRKKRKIYLQPIDDFPTFVSEFMYSSTGERKMGFIQLLRDFTEMFFSGFEVEVLVSIHLSETGWTVNRRIHDLTKQEQLLVTDLNRNLGKTLPRNGSCILGISWTDLYPSEDLNFVLGEASAADKSAMFSFGRFQPRLYREGNPPPPLTKINGDLIWKMIKVICHETCHLFHMSHCFFFKCLMNESSSVQEALEQPLFLCPICIRKLQKVCKFDLLRRYKLIMYYMIKLRDDFPSDKLSSSIMWLESCVQYFSDHECSDNL